MEANGVRVLTFLLSTITSEMLFKESDISCVTKHFFLDFLQIGLKRWTLVAKPFPLVIAGPALDDDGPSTSIASTFTKGSHWGSTNYVLSVESPNPSVLSFGIRPLVQNAFFPVATMPPNMMSMESRFGKPFFFLRFLHWDMPTCGQPVIRTQYNCRQ